MLCDYLASLRIRAINDAIRVTITTIDVYAEISETIFPSYIKLKKFIKLLIINGVNYEFKRFID
jgi:hypothetical protein